MTEKSKAISVGMFETKGKNTFMASFNTTVRQITEMFQRKKNRLLLPSSVHCKWTAVISLRVILGISSNNTFCFFATVFLSTDGKG